MSDFRYQPSRSYLHKVCKKCTKDNDHKRYHLVIPLPDGTSTTPRKIVARKAKLKEYGLTPEEYKALLSKCGGVCQLCGSKPLAKQLNVDHDHATGEVRGLLCNNCNLGLGHFKDSRSVLEKAIKYLNK